MYAIFYTQYDSENNIIVNFSDNLTNLFLFKKKYIQSEDFYLRGKIVNTIIGKEKFLIFPKSVINENRLLVLDDVSEKTIEDNVDTYRAFVLKDIVDYIDLKLDILNVWKLFRFAYESMFVISSGYYYDVQLGNLAKIEDSRLTLVSQDLSNLLPTLNTYASVMEQFMSIMQEIDNLISSVDKSMIDQSKQNILDIVDDIANKI